MKIALAQLNYHIGNFDYNFSKIKEFVVRAKNEGADLIIFAELAVTGYPPRDFLEFNDFIRKSNFVVDTLAKECVGISVIIGAPSVNLNKDGKPLFNSAYFLNEGKIQAIRHKTLLPTYDVFDEYRYFEPNAVFEVIEYKEYKIALTICEDLWNDTVENENNARPLYTTYPMEKLKAQSPDMIVNIAASPFSYAQAEIRKEVLSAKSKKYGLPLIYVNHVGAQTELLFDGGSMVMNSHGEVIEKLKYFEEDFKVINFKRINTSPVIPEKIINKTERIHEALVMGIRDYFGKMGLSKAIVGLSGGIDSAVTFTLAARALGIENVWGILMPSQFSSDHSINDARQLAENLGAKHTIIPIEDVYRQYMNSLQSLFNDLPFGLAEENLQARIRAVYLMALSNKFGYILLNTSNKSEAAVGYGTLYGDMCGGLSVLGDVYKTDIFALARYINKQKTVIPENTILNPPTAELRPDQKDSDSLPEYEILDKILFHYIESRKSPAELIEMGFNPELVNRTLKLVNTNEYKRAQTPPILRVSPKAFGMGRRLPIVGHYLS